jgi:methyl-accepting chemotaxis protein
VKDFVIPLVVAVIGLAATGLGAIVGARAARFGAERNAETVRRQVQDQGAVEHGHWLRQQRLNTYESFLEAWDECLRITQASAEAHDPDSTGLEDLREAAGRMAERARRIALLGPEEVTRAAEELTETMQEDVAVSTRFIEVAQAAVAAVDGRPVPAEAMADATEEYRQRTEELAELMRAYRDQGRSLRDLEGHPLLGEMMRSIEQYRQASREARGALQENVEQLSVTSDEASAMVDVLTRNKEARELSRERFTSAVRKTLGTPPISE